MSVDTTITCRGRDELLALASAIFGYVPHESLVCLRLADSRLSFSCRVDLDSLPRHVQDTVATLLHAAANVGGEDCCWVLLCWTAHPQRAVAGVLELARELGELGPVLFTDGVTSWELVAGHLSDPRPFDTRTAWGPFDAIRAHADVHATREEAVAELRNWSPSGRWTQSAALQVSALGVDEQVELLRCLVEHATPVGRDQAVLAELLRQDECFAELLAQLSTANAHRRRLALQAARAEASSDAMPNVISLMALAYWLEGNGTLANECLRQLELIDPEHPLGRTVDALIRLGIPPARWDEQ